MVLGGPRSGTTWAANWLTTDTTICLHDPLMEYTLQQLEQVSFPGKRVGIACTAAMLFPHWVNASKAKKVILYRSVPEINASLRLLGLMELDENKHYNRVQEIKGATLLPYEQLFTPKSAKGSAEYLEVPFDAARFDLLRQMRVEPMFRHLNVGRQAVTDLVARINEAR